jgi:predicted GNAT family acetyltransferase
MNDMPDNYGDLIDNEVLHRFELQVEGFTAWLDYKRSAGRLTLIHTETPGEIRGRGVAAALVERVLRYAEENGLKVVVLCSYAQSYLLKHPEWGRLLEKGIHVKGFNFPG